MRSQYYVSLERAFEALDYLMTAHSKELAWKAEEQITDLMDTLIEKMRQEDVNGKR